ncbi:hypothetical protein L1987_20293 [Smallanthus sonchifolius]|uniref:Uncharacterized protein n=1 Tax=Smallanthus sonchifolius TaxID=185202 RepID=A0ACB9IT44_9ASTR|nr:hypothetical protein L1987_20293 [Smallanthus sonchifolius]
MGSISLYPSGVSCETNLNVSGSNSIFQDTFPSISTSCPCFEANSASLIKTDEFNCGVSLYIGSTSWLPSCDFYEIPQQLGHLKYVLLHGLFLLPLRNHLPLH